MARSKHRATSSAPAARKPAGDAASAAHASADRARIDFLKAVRHFNVGDLTSATRFLEEILKARPTDFDALHLLGVITARRGDADKEADLIRRALLVRPDDSTARNNLADLLLNQGKAEDAVEVIKPALAASSPPIGLLFSYANAQRLLGAYTAAIDSYRATLMAAPTFVEAALNLTATLFHVGNFAEAERVVREAIERSPQVASLRLWLGSVLIEAGRAEDALHPLDQAASAGLVEARHKLGRAYFTLGRLDEAKRTLERAALDAPGNAAVRTELGIVLLALNADADAVRRLREAVARAPENAEGHAHLAEALRRTGALPEAISHGERATRFSPLSPVAWLNLGAALLDGARPQDARDALARAVALDPNSAKAERSYGAALETLGDHEAAQAAFERASAKS